MTTTTNNNRASMSTGLKIDDFQFLLSVVHYDELSINTAVLIADRLVMICVEHRHLFDFSFKCLLVLLKKFASNRQMRVFYAEFIQDALKSTYRSCEQDEDDFIPEYDKQLVAALISGVINLGIPTFNTDIADMTQETRIKFFRANGFDDTTLMKIARQLGLSMDIEPEQPPVTVQTRTDLESHPIQKWMASIQSPRTSVHTVDKDSSIVDISAIENQIPPDDQHSSNKMDDACSIKSDPLPNIFKTSSRDETSSVASVPQKRQRKNGLLNVRMQEIERIKQERREKLEGERLEKERQREREERIKQRLRKQYGGSGSSGSKKTEASPQSKEERRANSHHHHQHTEHQERVAEEAEEVEDSNRIALSILNDIFVSALGMSLTAHESHEEVPLHDVTHDTPTSPQKVSHKKKKANKSPAVPEKKTFFSAFAPEQRATVLFCLKLVDEMIEEVASGEAKVRIHQKEKREQERRRKVLLWRKKKQELSRAKESQDTSVESSTTAAPAASNDMNQQENTSAIQLHKLKIEMEKEEQRRQQREWDEKQRVKREKRQKELNDKLEEYKQKQREEQERKKQQELEEKRMEEERERKRRELEAKRREEEKQRIAEFKRQQEELLVQKERERQELEEQERVNRQKNVQKYLEKKTRKELELQQQVRAAIRIQRCWRRFIAKNNRLPTVSKRPKPPKSNKLVVKDREGDNTATSTPTTTDSASSQPTQVTVSHEAAPLVRRIHSSKSKQKPRQRISFEHNSPREQASEDDLHDLILQERRRLAESESLPPNSEQLKPGEV